MYLTYIIRPPLCNTVLEARPKV